MKESEMMNETEKQIYNEIERACRELELGNSKTRDAIHDLVDRCIDLVADEDNPASQALDDLWKAIILKRNPDYGDWEYPGQAYRHLLAEYEELKKADDWTIIDPADAGTLPQTMGIVLLSITDGYNEAMLPGYRGDMPGEFYSWTGEKIAPGTDITVYAYQILPEPAPLPGETADKTK